MSKVPSQSTPRSKGTATLRGGLHEGVLPLLALILFQAACTVFFMTDVAADLFDQGWSGLTDWHLLPELAATVGLVLGILYEVFLALRLLRREARMAQGLSVAAGALNEVIEAYFAQWGLTPSEEDIASFTIKGFSIAEIAQMRGSAEGTVKTHLNAIYRKSGTNGRAQLVSLLVEDLFRAPLVDRDGARPPPEEPV